MACHWEVPNSDVSPKLRCQKLGFFTDGAGEGGKSKTKRLARNDIATVDSRGSNISEKDISEKARP